MVSQAIFSGCHCWPEAIIKYVDKLGPKPSRVTEEGQQGLSRLQSQPFWDSAWKATDKSGRIKRTSPMHLFAPWSTGTSRQWHPSTNQPSLYFYWLGALLCWCVYRQERERLHNVLCLAERVMYSGYDFIPSIKCLQTISPNVCLAGNNDTSESLTAPPRQPVGLVSNPSGLVDQSTRVCSLRWNVYNNADKNLTKQKFQFHVTDTWQTIKSVLHNAFLSAVCMGVALTLVYVVLW